MGFVRAAISRLMVTGRISAAWYSILTGLALVFVAYLLGSVAADDAAAPYVAIGMAVLGVWQLERGLSAQFRRSPGATDDPA